MRLDIIFQTECLPLPYRMMVVSCVKEALQISDSEYCQYIYRSSKANRPFSFGVSIHDYDLIGEEFLVRGHVKVTIASPDPRFMLHLYNGIMNMSDFKYKNYSLKRLKVQMGKATAIDGNSVYFRTLSPLLIQGRDKKPISIQDEAFEKEFNYICNASLEAFRGYGLIQPLRFVPKSMKKVVVKESIHSGDKKLFFTGYQGSFAVQGAREDLELLSELGCGFRSSQGFGAVEVLA